MSASSTPALDVERLYRSSAPRITRIVSQDLRSAPAALVEEACQSAWAKLVLHRDEVESGAAVAWLTTTARREAVKMWRRAQRDLSLEGEFGAAAAATMRGPAALEPANVVPQRARLAELDRLPPRQQRLVWLQALGLSHEEIASLSGSSLRTVRRQLHRARRRLRELDVGAGD